MIDIHNHLLPGIDDGAKKIETTIATLKDMENYGYKKVVFTPHYIIDSKYISSKGNNLRILEEVKEQLKENNIKIKVYLGNEIFIDDDLLKNLKKDLISSLNNTNYLLIELPLSGEYDEYKEIFEELIEHKYNIILAHPERYMSFQKDYKKILELEEIGVYFQCNIESIIGSYGIRARKLIRKMLKNKKVTFLATDIHHRKQDYTKWDKAKKEIIKLIGENEWNALTNKNPSRLTD